VGGWKTAVSSKQVFLLFLCLLPSCLVFCVCVCVCAFVEHSPCNYKVLGFKPLATEGPIGPLRAGANDEFYIRQSVSGKIFISL